MHEHRRLTTEAVVWSVTAGDDGRRRIRARTAATGVGDDGSIRRFTTSQHGMLEEEVQDVEADQLDISSWGRVTGPDLSLS